MLVRAMVAVQSAILSRSSEMPAGQNHHYWLDPANGSTIAKAILDRLVLLDPASADAFRANYARFSARLTERLAGWDAQMKPFEGTPIASAHRSWTYLARRHGLPIVTYVEPPEPLVLGATNLDNAPDRGERAVLVATLSQRRVRLLLAETYLDQAPLQGIARDAGAALVALPSSVSQTEGIPDYFALFDRIYATLTRALTATAPPR
jgi:ABC-type Zn uptake system ZnuABC Zn-binding protein ZnuA